MLGGDLHCKAPQDGEAGCKKGPYMLRAPNGSESARRFIGEVVEGKKAGVSRYGDVGRRGELERVSQRVVNKARSRRKDLLMSSASL